MASIKNQIAGFAVSASCLNATSGKPSGLTVRRGRLLNSTTVSQPEVLVYVGPEIEWTPVGTRRSGNPIKRAFRLLCEIRANGAIPDEVLDPLEVWVESRLFADETFGGLATGIINKGSEQDASQSDRAYAVCTLFVDVEFTTQRGLPETRGDA